MTNELLTEQQLKEFSLLLREIEKQQTLVVLREVAAIESRNKTKIERLPFHIRIQLANWMIEGGKTQKEILGMLNEEIRNCCLPDSYMISRSTFSEYTRKIERLKLTAINTK